MCVCVCTRVYAHTLILLAIEHIILRILEHVQGVGRVEKRTNFSSDHRYRFFFFNLLMGAREVVQRL